MSAPSPPRDVHSTITDQIVAAIERGAGDFHMPWHRSRGSTARPWNVASGKRYQGINVVGLWLAAEAQAYPHPIWGTYRQWQTKGAQVRRGERSSTVVFYKTLQRDSRSPDEGENENRQVALARASHVFNAAQVEGYQTSAELFIHAPNPVEPIAAADMLVVASGAVVREGGDRAFYSPQGDFVAMPARERFGGSPTMTPTEAFYAVLLHELTHYAVFRIMPRRSGIAREERAGQRGVSA